MVDVDFFSSFFQSFLNSLHERYGLKGCKTTSTSKAGKILCMDDNSHSPNPIIYHMVLYTHSNTYEKESPIQLLPYKNPGHKNKKPKLNQYTKLYQSLFTSSFGLWKYINFFAVCLLSLFSWCYRTAIIWLRMMWRPYLFKNSLP